MASVRHVLSFTLVAGASAALVAGAQGQALGEPALSPVGASTTVKIAPGPGPGLRRFDPATALGVDLDGHDQGINAQIYTPANVRAMGSAGLGNISYRLRTELGIEAWHWNPVGRFSDTRQQQGYWTSSPVAGRRVGTTYGYTLPRRGDSIDQAENTGYSRLDDGDPASFWKSDPYLDPHFAGRSSDQWVLMDLGRPRPVNRLGVLWGTPWGTRLRAQWWTGTKGSANALSPPPNPPGDWRDFPHGDFRGRRGTQVLRLAKRPLNVRFVRILLERSSHTSPAGSRDVRDRLGFAIRELRLGRQTPTGGMHDWLRHVPDGARQTTTMTSSTDPWHRASDRDPAYAQPSFDQVEAGLAHRRPLMVPVALLYGTPADAVNELRFLHTRRYPVSRVELGEEPDGQLAEPEGYAALYASFARALRRVDQIVALGGPGFQTSLPDWAWWPDARGRRSWTGRFVAELARRRALGQLNYFSFEWYPFDRNCQNTGAQLQRQPRLLADVIATQRQAGLPPGLPLVITELGYSAFAGRVEDDLPGAVLDADVIAGLLAQGGQAAYLYGLEPAQPMQARSCRTWGSLGLFTAGDNGQVRQPLAAYWGLRMLREDWAGPGPGRDALLATTSDLSGPAGSALVGAYALRRSDGRIAVLLLNRDVGAAHSANLRVGDQPLPGPLEVSQLGGAQYVWHPRGPHGFARPDGPPARSTLPVADTAQVTLPPASITVVRTLGPA